jgi:hypothetical protein
LGFNAADNNLRICGSSRPLAPSQSVATRNCAASRAASGLDQSAKIRWFFLNLPILNCEPQCGRRLRVSSCGVYLPDLDQPRPPDLPPNLVKLRIIKKG